MTDLAICIIGIRDPEMERIVLRQAIEVLRSPDEVRDGIRLVICLNSHSVSNSTSSLILDRAHRTSRTKYFIVRLLLRLAVDLGDRQIEARKGRLPLELHRLARSIHRPFVSSHTLRHDAFNFLLLCVR